ncbi:hypothetical protein C0581_00485 [Candidatus Parcubacteria bacterium]|nr:MAG: hypothetical protein C0581_00485 [Candidatus Parcubacteria bacterium]
MKNNISDNILDKIKDTKPKSRFAFLAKNYAFWSAALLSIVIGAITVSVMIFIFVNHEWALAGRASGMFKNLVYVLPYFWLVIFLLFIIIAYYEVRHVRGGYKIALPIILGVYIFSTFLLGFGLYKVGVGNSVEEFSVDHAPLYHHLAEKRQQLLQNPEQGIIIGKVMGMKEDSLNLVDFKENVWDVNTEEVFISPHVKMDILLDKIIIIYGEKVGDREFEAEGIKPYMLPGRGPGMMKGVRGMKEMREGVRIIE